MKSDRLDWDSPDQPFRSAEMDKFREAMLERKRADALIVEPLARTPLGSLAFDAAIGEWRMAGPGDDPMKGPVINIHDLNIVSVGPLAISAQPGDDDDPPEPPDDFYNLYANVRLG